MSSLLSPSGSHSPVLFLRHCLSACGTGGEHLTRLRIKLTSKALWLLMANDYLSSADCISIADELSADLEAAPELESGQVLRLVGECRNEIRDKGSGGALRTRWFGYLALLVASLRCRERLCYQDSQEEGEQGELDENLTGAEFRTRYVV